MKIGDSYQDSRNKNTGNNYRVKFVKVNRKNNVREKTNLILICNNKPLSENWLHQTIKNSDRHKAKSNVSSDKNKNNTKDNNKPNSSKI